MRCASSNRYCRSVPLNVNSRSRPCSVDISPIMPLAWPVCSPALNLKCLSLSLFPEPSIDSEDSNGKALTTPGFSNRPLIRRRAFGTFAPKVVLKVISGDRLISACPLMPITVESMCISRSVMTFPFLVRLATALTGRSGNLMSKQCPRAAIVVP